MGIFYRQVVGIFIALALMMSVAWAAEPDVNAAGQVIVVSGPFQAINKDKQTRILERGAYFYSGDSLMTGTNGSAQIRFSDGTVMALNTNSQIRIDNYSYQKDPKKDKSTVSLVKGGFRALTGLMSKSNPDSYQVETPVAVIGVRGTNYSAALDRGELYAGVWKGVIIAKNDAGAINLGDGQDYSYAVVKAKNVAPIGLLNPPVQLTARCGTQEHAPHTNF